MKGMVWRSPKQWSRLPIIATGEGAVASTIPKEAGIVVETNDLTQFTSALSILITDSNQRETLW